MSGSGPATPGRGGSGGGQPAAAAPPVTELHFDYVLERAGETPIEENGSTPLGCPGAGCPADDLRALAGRDGTGTRAGFATATGTTGGPPLTRAFCGASATVTDATFTRYGFWGEHGYAAVEIGSGMLSAEADGQTWTGTFERLMGTAELRIADLSQPRIDVDIDLDDGGDGVALEWRRMRLSDGAFAKGAAGADRI